MKCENSVMCNLCDGVSLYKNTSEEKAVKRANKEANKQAEKDSILKVYKQEKKEGMAFEKRVAKKWNQHMGQSSSADSGLKVYDKKKKVGKPRIDLSSIVDSVSNEDHKEKVEEVFTAGLVGIRLGASNMTRPKPVITPISKPTTEAKRQINSGALWHSKGDIKLDHALMECKERGTVTARGAKQITIPKEWLDKQEKEAFQEQRDYWYIPFGYKGDDSIYLVKPYDHELEIIYELRKAREEIERLQAMLNLQDRMDTI